MEEAAIQSVKSQSNWVFTACPPEQMAQGHLGPVGSEEGALQKWSAVHESWSHSGCTPSATWIEVNAQADERMCPAVQSTLPYHQRRCKFYGIPILQFSWLLLSHLEKKMDCKRVFLTSSLVFPCHVRMKEFTIWLKVNVLEIFMGD